MDVPGPHYPYEKIPDDLPIVDLKAYDLKPRKGLAAARRLHVLDQMVLDRNIAETIEGNPRYCQIATTHDPHEYYYEYDRPEHLGGHTRGHYWCDGVPLIAQKEMNETE